MFVFTQLFFYLKLVYRAHKILLENEGIDVASLQDRETGAFAGDEWGEIDTRFLYGAFNTLSLLGKLNYIDVEKAVNYVYSCKNYDGGFGMVPGAESHAAQSMRLHLFPLRF